MATAFTCELELAKLCQEDHDGEAVYEAQHDRVRHHTDEFTPPQKADDHLNNAHQNDRREEILNAVLCHQMHHDNGQRACRAGDHAGTSAKYSGDQSDKESGIETDQRVHPGDERKRDGLWYKGQSDGQAGQQFDLDTIRGQLDRRRIGYGLGACGQGRLRYIDCLLFRIRVATRQPQPRDEFPRLIAKFPHCSKSKASICFSD